jgi:serine/threonine protein kinase
MRCVHSKGIIQRNPTPSNTLFDQHWRPKIIDFGMSIPEPAQSPATGDTGTIWYAAPKHLIPGGRHTTRIDVFSFGHILYGIVTGEAVFAISESVDRVQQRIRKRDLPKLPDHFGRLMGRLIYRCWSENPALRPSFEGFLGEFEACGFDILPRSDRQYRGRRDHIRKPGQSKFRTRGRSA